ncbi:prepilin-type N-terminal cleavage/methylation domain-containing protein [Pseudoduganella sp. GCM10020061]|uniref:type IV pilus modification PilV family protein n=1 Tax=Pseudoduganella sp. GCM10020061 TaxID=3317345 RepID=UPI00363622A4
MNHFNHTALRRARGTSLIEVLVTLVIVAFGLLGVAAFQAKAQVGSVESYQRAQAIILLDDMTSRINVNSDAAADYVGTFGTADEQPADCSEADPGVDRDLCEWSAALKGAAEVDESGTQVGGMIGARGCIEQVTIANPAPGVCTPAVYRVTVAWQGLHETRAPALSCGRNAYGTDTFRRAISSRITVGLTTCS